MKLSDISIFAAAAMMLTACSNEEAPTPNNGPEQTESGYISLGINLPTVSGIATKAVDYEAGDADEYAVLNGKVVVFRTAATEGDATCVCVSDLSGMNWSAAQGGEITTTSSATARLLDINMRDNAAQYSALVILNYNDTFKFPVVGQKFSTWQKDAQTNNMTATADGKTYLTMTQAPVWTGAQSNPTTLVPLDKSKIAQTESGLNGNAATFNVQRNVAKVMVTTGEYNISGSNYSGDKIKLDAWTLDITNKKSYPMQVTDGLMDSYSAIWSKARFSGAENAKFRRLFWAMDPNYNKDYTTLDAVAAEFNVVNNSNLTAAPSKLYCLENTFDINHQLQGQTTRVVLKGTYTPNSIPGYTAGATFFKVGNSTQLWLQNTLEAEIKGRAATALNSANVTVSIANIANAGNTYALNAVSIKNNGTEIGASDRDKVAQALGLKNATDKSISCYLHGECYYVVRVKHFGDSETPWELGDETYGGNNDRWLGRYGIVRNTAYSVNVTSVSNPGSPCVPEINPTDPDDISEYYIQASINILAWAKRVNNTDL